MDGAPFKHAARVTPGRLAVAAAALGVLVLSLHCGGNGEKRKIRLSSTGPAARISEQPASLLYLQPALRRAIAVMIFDNRTGDPRLEWLRQGLAEMFIRALAQSQRISVMSTERFYDVLTRLGGETDSAELELENAIRFAKEANVEAFLRGDISRTGDSLRITVHLHEAAHGKLIQEESAAAVGLEHIFAMVDDLSGTIRDNLQQTLAQGAEDEERIIQPATRSLEALKHYIAGVNYANQYLRQDAVNEFRAALGEDSTYIDVYLRLSPLLLSLGEDAEAYETYRKVLSLRDSASLRERYQIDILEAQATNDQARIMDISRQWYEAYPGDIDPNINLANIYYSWSEWNLAAAYFNNVLEIDPFNKVVNTFLAYVHARMGDFERAARYEVLIRERYPEESNTWDSAGEIAAYQGNYRKAEKFYSISLMKNANFLSSRIALGRLQADQGRYEEARKIFFECFDYTPDRNSKADLLRQIGLTCWRKGDYDMAEASFQKLKAFAQVLYESMIQIARIRTDRDPGFDAGQYWAQQYDILTAAAAYSEPALSLLLRLGVYLDIKGPETAAYLAEHDYSDLVKGPERLLPEILSHRYRPGPGDAARSGRVLEDVLETIVRTGGPVYISRFWESCLYLNDQFSTAPDTVFAVYARMIDRCRKQGLLKMEMLLRSFRADLYFRTGKPSAASGELAICGIPPEQAWLTAGPYADRQGFTYNDIDVTAAAWEGYAEQGDVWKPFADAFHDGYLDFSAWYPDRNWSAAYTLLFVESDIEQDVQLRTGATGPQRLYLNNKEIWKINVDRNAVIDEVCIDAHLVPGINTILMKTSNDYGAWGVYFRITDSDGRGAPHIRYRVPL
ncbi:hypothetical protein JXO52_11555 [bacterium]|nr:hypothetical protein [bacterium]